MNGANGETSSSTSGGNGEQLDGVLGRFEDWARTRRINPLASYGATAGISPKAVSQKSKLIAEARELSYEKALKASRFRRMPEFVPVELAPLPVQEPDSEKLAVAADSVPIPAAVPAEPAVPFPANPEPGAAATIANSAPASPVLLAAASLASTPLLSTSVGTPGQPSSRNASRKGAGRRSIPALLPLPVIATSATALSNVQSRARSKSIEARTIPKAARTAISPHPPPKRPDHKRVAVAAAEPIEQIIASPAQTAASPGKRSAPASFQEALQASIQRSTALPHAEAGKGASLTMRITDAEQARIQTRASQAKLSVSAYVRQCALGVDRGLREAHEHRTVSAYLRHSAIVIEDLREQIDVLLQREHPAPPAPGLSAIPGILARFLKRCFRRSSAPESAKSP